MNHNKKLVVVSAITLALSGCGQEPANTDISPKESVTVKAKQQHKQLAIEKYTLPNGLDVVLHQDRSDPVVAVAIQYHVGSNREVLGRTGFAHFFEHMLFQNSENVGAGNFIKNIGNMGGTLNGGTWQDGTIYYEVVPSDGLEKILWMESDYGWDRWRAYDLLTHAGEISVGYYAIGTVATKIKKSYLQSSN